MKEEDLKLILDKLDNHAENINLILVNSTEIKTIQRQHNKEINGLTESIINIKKEVIEAEKDIVNIKNNINYFKDILKELKTEDISSKSKIENINKIQTTNQPVIDNQKRLNWLFISCIIAGLISLIFKIVLSLYIK